MMLPIERTENIGAKVVPLYAARIGDLGPGDFVEVDCAACSHTALLALAFLDPLGRSPRHKVLDLKDRVRCRGCGARGWAVVSIKWGKLSCLPRAFVAPKRKTPHRLIPMRGSIYDKDGEPLDASATDAAADPACSRRPST